MALGVVGESLGDGDLVDSAGHGASVTSSRPLSSTRPDSSDYSGVFIFSSARKKEQDCC